MSRIELPRGRVATLSLTIVLAGFSTTGNAQEIRAISEEIHQFNSPMVLEMSLDPLVNKPVGEKWTTDKTRFFVCRGVTIESLEFRVQPQIGSPPPPGGRSGRSVWHEKRIQIRVFLNNNSGKDKKINIRFEGVDGETVFCMASIQALLEQGDNDKQRAELLDEPTERWTQPPRPRLRVTLTLQDY